MRNAIQLCNAYWSFYDKAAQFSNWKQNIAFIQQGPTGSYHVVAQRFNKVHLYLQCTVIMVLTNEHRGANVTVSHFRIRRVCYLQSFLDSCTFPSTCTLSHLQWLITFF